MKSAIFLSIAIMLFTLSCTWVEPTPTGSQINLVESSDNLGDTCQKLGSVTTMVKHKVVSIKSSED